MMGSDSRAVRPEKRRGQFPQRAFKRLQVVRWGRVPSCSVPTPGVPMANALACCRTLDNASRTGSV